MPPVHGEIARYAAYLAKCLGVLGVDVPDSFEKLFVWHARRAGPGNYEDLGSLILLECQERKVEKVGVDGQELKRMVDRIRHKMTRRAGRETPLDITGRAVSKDTPNAEGTEAVLHRLSLFLQELSPTHALLFELHFVQGQPVRQIEQKCGIPKSTVYGKLAEIKQAFRGFGPEHEGGLP